VPLPDGFRWTISYGNNFLHAGDLIVAPYSERVVKDGWVIFAYRFRAQLVSARAPLSAPTCAGSSAGQRRTRRFCLRRTPSRGDR
jgi:hypothetical protein